MGHNPFQPARSAQPLYASSTTYQGYSVISMFRTGHHVFKAIPWVHARLLNPASPPHIPQVEEFCPFSHGLGLPRAHPHNPFPWLLKDQSGNLCYSWWTVSFRPSTPPARLCWDLNQFIYLAARRGRRWGSFWGQGGACYLRGESCAVPFSTVQVLAIPRKGRPSCEPRVFGESRKVSILRCPCPVFQSSRVFPSRLCSMYNRPALAEQRSNTSRALTIRSTVSFSAKSAVPVQEIRASL